MTLGFTNGTNNAGAYAEQPGAETRSSLRFVQNMYGQNVGTTSPTTATLSNSIGITTDPTKSGIIVEPDADLVVCIKF